MPDDIHSEPLIEIAIEPKSRADQEKLSVALAKLVAEDLSFRVSTDQESGQTIMKGASELHLDAKVDSLKRTYKIDANIGAPQVAFRERPTRRAEVRYTHKRQTGDTGQFAEVSIKYTHKKQFTEVSVKSTQKERTGTGQFAEVSIVVEPNEPGKGYQFESKIVGGAVPKEYIPGVEQGLKSVRGSG